ncbi:hypothetical protein EI94DRAFT_1706873 [Lactarius quietus]|nr:hypothetical protein EI94DRAFT_1706873 [Lactarius quietus]
MHFMHGFHGWEGYNGHFSDGRGVHDKHFLTEELPELLDWPTGGAANNLTWAHQGAANDVVLLWLSQILLRATSSPANAKRSEQPFFLSLRLAYFSAVCNLQNALSQHEELLAEATDATVNIPRNGKKHHSAPSDKCKVLLRQLLQDWQQKEKWLSELKQLLPVHPRGKLEMMKMHKSPNLEDSHNESWQDEPVPVEESSNRRKDGGNEEGFLHAEGEDNNKTFKDLKMEVQALTARCDEYERIIKDIQSACDTHENILEMLRQQIVNIHDSGGTLNSMYGGKNYDLIS